ncbi:interleukin-13 receptor subunit alpha-2-like [Acipenser ruthenus]|uniref:interleukin-13 receptor subunit alpha-2-like n=1 Tax=Acipenser ruthenus TaxID=7906 RepID=UPI00145A07DE|nr:interleukin-13 receptor subunit alpha-2-like [Acipenser ruthenus]XP_033877078.1 interleukin-13 receptor subunit alpha-2-like [Acipenser ruthenus]
MGHLKILRLSMLVLIYWKICKATHLTTVDPPTNLQILDPGYLGELHIEWQAPASLRSISNCVLRYQLQYYSTDEGRWKTVRTTHLKHSARFDLGKEAKVKVQSLLKGQCTNGSELQSVWAERTLQPSQEGIPESRIKNLACVFYNWEYMECTWQRPPYLNYNLFYWHSKLDHAMECADYIQSNGVNIGCNFSSADLEDYTDFNICVNGSSAAGPLIPVYFRFELQNLVKPAVIKKINVTKVGNERLHLEWKPPVGKIKSHCLEYEVQCREDENEWTSNFKKGTTFTSFRFDPRHRHCFRVRSKLNMYCADNELWSDWTANLCFTEEYELSEASMFIALGTSLIILFAIALSLWIRRRGLKIKGGEDGILL